MGEILISIIVPIHQFGIYFYKCLDCIFAQTEQNFELFIIDDNSDDEIPSKISYYLSDPRCHYIRLNEQLGPGGARNKGMALAQGRYITFCDSDDWIDLNYCKTACEILEATNADIAMCGQIREYETPAKTPVYKCKYDDVYELSGKMAFQIMSYNYQAGINIIPPCTNKIYRHNFLNTFDFRFQEKVYFQDTIFSVETLLNAQKIVCVPKVLYHHYRRKGSIIQSFDTKHVTDFKNLGTSIHQYLTKKGIYEQYQKNYYNMITHFYGVIIREIFEFVSDDAQRKCEMVRTFSALEEVIDKNEYLNFLTAEQLRRHLIPDMDDTTLY